MPLETTASIVLTTWERAYGLEPVERGLALLGLARPREPIASLAQLSIGQRDAALLNLRSTLFGEEIQSLDACPECQEKIEVSFRVDNIRVADTSRQIETSSGETPSATVAVVEINGRPWTIRPATTHDLMAVQRQPTAPSRREALLNRCVSRTCISSVNAESTDIAPIEFCESDLKSINDKLVEIDPQADVRIALNCTRCGHKWSSRFDIVSFLWSEIDAWAQRLLGEVHSLAFAYGWSEREILGLSPWRRHLYLGMLRR